jgi:hypothetical protein
MLLILPLMPTAPPVQKHDSMTHYIILALASMQKATADSMLDGMAFSNIS